MELIVRKSHSPASPVDPEAPGPVYAVVPAHGGSNADAISKYLGRELATRYRLSVLLADFCSHGFPLWGTPEAPQRLDGRTWGAFVTPGTIFDTLEAREAHPRNIPRLFDTARSKYRVICADLTDAKESSTVEVLRNADSIFLVSSNDIASIELARYRSAWLRSMDLDDRTGLVLNRVRGGVNGSDAEERTGLPVCAAVEGPEDLAYLAAWLAAPLIPQRAQAIRRAG